MGRSGCPLGDPPHGAVGIDVGRGGERPLHQRGGAVLPLLPPRGWFGGDMGFYGVSFGDGSIKEGMVDTYIEPLFGHAGLARDFGVRGN